MAPDSDVGNSTDAFRRMPGLLRNGVVLGVISAVAYSLANLADFSIFFELQAAMGAFR